MFDMSGGADMWRQQLAKTMAGARPASMQQDAPPPAEFTFTPTPHLFNPHAQAEQAARQDRQYHNDQPLDRNFTGTGERLPDPFRGMGEGTDPWGTQSVQRNNQMLQKPGPSQYQQMIDLLSGSGQGV